MRVIQFTVAGIAQPKGSTRGFVRRRRDGVLVANVAPDNAKSKPWADAIAWTAKTRTNGIALVGPIRLNLAFHLPRPQRTAAMFPTKKPDLDKLIRCVLDALTGVLYDDDSQVVDILATKRYGVLPRVEIIASTYDG